LLAFVFERWNLKTKIMDIEKQIIKKMEDTGYERLYAIASMNLGKRNEYAVELARNLVGAYKKEYGWQKLHPHLILKLWQKLHPQLQLI